MLPARCVLLLSMLAAMAPLLAGQDVGQMAPNFAFSKSWNLLGEAKDLAAMQGRPVLVEHWATWCPPCVANVPHMNELHNQYGPRGLVIIAVSNEYVSAIDGFIKRYGLRYPVVQSTSAAGLYGVDSIPRAFLIDGTGRITWTGHPGKLTGAQIEPLLTATGGSGNVIPDPEGAASNAGLWFGLIGALAVVMLGALGWVWWKTSDRSVRPAVAYTPAYPAQVPPAGAPPPGNLPPGAAPAGSYPPPMPEAAPVAPQQDKQPASSGSQAAYLGKGGQGKTIRLTPSGRFPTVPYAPQAEQQLHPEPEPEMPEYPPAPSAPPVQFKPFHPGGPPPMR